MRNGIAGSSCIAEFVRPIRERRTISGATRSRIVALAVAVTALFFSAAVRAEAVTPGRPNILWITCEDMSPNLGCYGDAYAVTPHLDRLASQSVRYLSAFAPIGVCAPSRSTLITGMYASSLGTLHMRCQGQLPTEVKCFSEYLRQAGYYCTNNVKTDYNFTPPKNAWDESSTRAHWRKRGKDQPFFSVFNITTTHESQIRLPEDLYRKRTSHFTPRERHDPTKAPLPPYHPDLPEVRRDWARYYDMITVMDSEAGAILRQLEEDGLVDDTIVFFFSDHGSGMPRSKYWLYDSSIHVPLIVRFPARFREPAPADPGGTSDQLVSFVDFAPTVLSLAGAAIPAHMQGRAFLGRQAAQPRDYVFGFRNRMGTRTDMIRCVRDHRYKYIRNYMPFMPYFRHQYPAYHIQIPTMRIWQQLAEEGKLTGPPAQFMTLTKPSEELYDTRSDPWEIRNLASDPALASVLERMRPAMRAWMSEIRDLGLLAEADLRTRFGEQSPYDAVRRDPACYPLERIQEAADLAGRMTPDNTAKLIDLLKDPDEAVRYWAALGLGALGNKAQPAIEPLSIALKDASPSVRLGAAEALVGLGREQAVLPVLIEGLEHGNEWVRLQAAQILDRMDEKARPAVDAMRRAGTNKTEYVGMVLDHALEQLGAQAAP